MLDLDQIARANDFPTDREIVVYCNCPNEVSAARAAATLVAQGLLRARPLAGGLDAWVAAGRATEPIAAGGSVPQEERMGAG
jgi:rhodanese-related sulfurtransferase